MQVRLAKISDIERIIYVHSESWKTTYNGILPKDYLENISPKEKKKSWETNGIHYPNSKGSTWVLEDNNNEIQGFASAGPQRNPELNGVGELYSIYILKEFRKLGGGTLLINAAMKSLHLQGYHSASVLVLKDNQSKKFYENLGAEKIEEIPFEILGIHFLEIKYIWKDLTQFKIT